MSKEDDIKILQGHLDTVRDLEEKLDREQLRLKRLRYLRQVDPQYPYTQIQNSINLEASLKRGLRAAKKAKEKFLRYLENKLDRLAEEPLTEQEKAEIREQVRKEHIEYLKSCDRCTLCGVSIPVDTPITVFQGFDGYTYHEKKCIKCKVEGDARTEKLRKAYEAFLERLKRIRSTIYRQQPR